MLTILLAMMIQRKRQISFSMEALLMNWQKSVVQRLSFQKTAPSCTALVFLLLRAGINSAMNITEKKKQ
jgi:hypothetical protein